MPSFCPLCGVSKSVARALCAECTDARASSRGRRRRVRRAGGSSTPTLAALACGAALLLGLGIAIHRACGHAVASAENAVVASVVKPATSSLNAPSRVRDEAPSLVRRSSPVAYPALARLRVDHLPPIRPWLDDAGAFAVVRDSRSRRDMVDAVATLLERLPRPFEVDLAADDKGSVGLILRIPSTRRQILPVLEAFVPGKVQELAFDGGAIGRARIGMGLLFEAVIGSTAHCALLWDKDIGGERVAKWLTRHFGANGELPALLASRWSSSSGGGLQAVFSMRDLVVGLGGYATLAWLDALGGKEPLPAKLLGRTEGEHLLLDCEVDLGSERALFHRLLAGGSVQPLLGFLPADRGQFLAASVDAGGVAELLRRPAVASVLRRVNLLEQMSTMTSNWDGRLVLLPNERSECEGVVGWGVADGPTALAAIAAEGDCRETHEFGEDHPAVSLVESGRVTVHLAVGDGMLWVATADPCSVQALRDVLVASGRRVTTEGLSSGPQASGALVATWLHSGLGRLVTLSVAVAQGRARLQVRA